MGLEYEVYSVMAIPKDIWWAGLPKNEFEFIPEKMVILQKNYLNELFIYLKIHAVVYSFQCNLVILYFFFFNIWWSWIEPISIRFKYTLVGIPVYFVWRVGDEFDIPSSHKSLIASIY